MSETGLFGGGVSCIGCHDCLQEEARRDSFNSVLILCISVRAAGPTKRPPSICGTESIHVHVSLPLQELGF